MTGIEEATFSRLALELNTTKIAVKWSRNLVNRFNENKEPMTYEEAQKLKMDAIKEVKKESKERLKRHEQHQRN